MKQKLHSKISFTAYQQKVVAGSELDEDKGQIKEREKDNENQVYLYFCETSGIMPHGN